MLSDSPVTACSPCGIAQKAPARRGKNRNSATASGSDRSSARPASLSAARPPRPGAAMTASAAQHSHASPAYSGARTSASRSRQAASNRNSATPSMTHSSRALRVSSSFSAAISSSSVVPAASPLSVWYRASTSSDECQRQQRARDDAGVPAAAARGGESPGDDGERGPRGPQRQPIDMQQHPAGECGAGPDESRQCRWRGWCGGGHA